MPFSIFVPGITVHVVNEMADKRQGSLQRAQFMRLTNLAMLPKP